jgi:hypothetical protein
VRHIGLVDADVVVIRAGALGLSGAEAASLSGISFCGAYDKTFGSPCAGAP